MIAAPAAVSDTLSHGLASLARSLAIEAHSLAIELEQEEEATEDVEIRAGRRLVERYNRVVVTWS